MKKKVFRFAAYAIFVIGLFLILETALQVRGFYRHRSLWSSIKNGTSHYVPSNNKILGYETKANVIVKDKCLYQQDGGRFSPDIPVENPGTKFRIALIGDSVTGQWAYPETESFGEKMKEKLSKSVDVELLCWALQGYSSEQNVEFFKEKILKYKPDFLVVQQGVDDLDSPQKEDFASPDFRIRCRSLTFFDYYLLQTDHIVRTHFLNRYTTENREKTYGALKKLIALCREKNIDLVLVIFPFFNTKVYENSRYSTKLAQYTDEVKKTFDGSPFCVVDLKEEFAARKVDLSSKRYTEADFVHMNKAGHALVGEIISEKINERPVFLKFVRTGNK